VQWGGPYLFEHGQFATPDGRARLTAVRLQGRRLDPHTYFVSTRRGKQFNSMVQRDVDPLTGASRDSILISSDDAERIGASDGTRLRLISTAGAFEGRAFVSPIRSGNLEIHWPEGLPLVDARLVDPESGEPDYNAVVRIEVLS